VRRRWLLPLLVAPLLLVGSNSAIKDGGNGPFCDLPGLNACQFSPQEWMVWEWTPERFDDIPDTTNDWVLTSVGTACTTAKGNVGYSFFRVLTGALDNDTCTLSLNQAAGFPVVNHQMSRDHYFELLFRVDEATSDADTVDEMELFFGMLLISDVDPLDTAVDYIGIWKRDQNDDATNNLYFVSGDFGGATLNDQHKSAIGWTSEAAAIGDGNVDANRAARLFGPGNWTQIIVYAEAVSGTPLNFSANVHVFVNGFAAPGSPFLVVQQIPDASLTIALAIKNGEAASRRIDIGRLVVARKLRSNDGSISRFTD
jgi:hypothetical protein